MIIYINLNSERSLPLKVTKKDENDKCTLVLPESTSTSELSLNKNSKGISIENKDTQNTVKLDSTEDGTIELTSLTTNNVVNVNPMKDAVFDFINFYQTSTVENKATDKSLSANHIKIQQKATANLNGFKILKDLDAAPFSKVIFKKVDFEGKTLNVLYSQAQEVGVSIFNGELNQVPGSIKVSYSDPDKILADENMTIAEGTKENFNIDNCTAWAEKVSGDFGNAVCDESDPDNNKVVAKKLPPKDKKKKLSGGAIAGIVIACVVVVAAIIALLVYFLVIKKKNQSTTSTQGDSSIAI